MAILEFTVSDELAKRGSAALALVQQLAHAIACCENELEARLQNVLADLTQAEDRHSLLLKRAESAEKRAGEAEDWLRQLHDRLQHELVSAKRHVVPA